MRNNQEARFIGDCEMSNLRAQVNFAVAAPELQVRPEGYKKNVKFIGLIDRNDGLHIQVQTVLHQTLRIGTSKLAILRAPYRASGTRRPAG